MDDCFFDSSAIVKRYIAETGTIWVENITNLKTGNNIYLARITCVETVSAIVRRARGGSITQSDAQKALALFRHDFANNYYKIEIAPQLLDDAMQIAEKHILRGYDAVQLAAALELRAELQISGTANLTFVSADDALNATAIVEGLTIENPNHHP